MLSVYPYWVLYKDTKMCSCTNTEKAGKASFFPFFLLLLLILCLLSLIELFWDVWKGYSYLEILPSCSPVTFTVAKIWAKYSHSIINLCDLKGEEITTSDISLSRSLYTDTLLTTDNGPFLPVNFN